MGYAGFAPAQGSSAGAITTETGDVNEVAFFNGATTLDGVPQFTWSGTTLTVDGTISGDTGLTVRGGTAASNSLTLRATSHATDGNIIFQTDPTTESGRFVSTGQLLAGRTTTVFASDVADFQKDQNGTTSFGIINESTATDTSTEIYFAQQGSASASRGCRLVDTGTTFTATGLLIANTFHILSGNNFAGHRLRLSSSGTMDFFPGGGLQGTWFTSGTLRLEQDLQAFQINSYPGFGLALRSSGTSFTLETTTALSIVTKINSVEKGRFASTGEWQTRNHTGFSGADWIRNTGAVQTTNAVQTTLLVTTLTDNRLYWLEAHVVGRDEAGTERAAYVIRVRAHRQGGGGATVSTVQADWTEETNAGLDATFTVSGNDVRVSVTGLAGTTIDWVCTLGYQGVSTSA